MVYLPKERLLIEADSFTPPPPSTPRPAVANANNVNLVNNIERPQLSVDRIFGGGVVVWGDAADASMNWVPPLAGRGLPRAG